MKIISALFAILVLGLLASSLLVSAQTVSYTPIDFKFVADIEVAWNQGNATRTSSARVFGDPTTQGYPCVIVTANRTEIAMPQNFQLARVTICGGKPVNMQFSQLDAEFQMLARVCGVMKYPTTWATPMVQQQLAGVPVYTGEAACLPTPDAACTCTCRYAFNPPGWVGEEQNALRAGEITNCANNCFPDAFITVMSMMKIAMTPEIVIGDCDSANEGAAVSAPTPGAWNSDNNQNSDGTTITYNFGAPTDFPNLPQSFAANFKVTLLEYGVSIAFSQVFNSILRASRTTIFSVAKLGQQEFATGETYITQGTSQLVYRIEHDTVRGDDSAAARYGSADSCERMLFAEDIFASSVQRLLMVPATAPPVFLGRYTVRGVACNLWSQAVSATLKVDWYFPLSEPTAYNPNNELLPRRIVLRGAGRSPFFANHPFVPTAANLKTVDATYCDRIPFFLDPHCTGDSVGADANFQHVIEIAELPRYIADNATVYQPPASCIGSSVVSAQANGGAGINPALAFFLSFLTFGVGIGSARMWCPGKKDEDEHGEDWEKEHEGNNHAQQNASSAPSSVRVGVDTGVVS